MKCPEENLPDISFMGVAARINVLYEETYCPSEKKFEDFTIDHSLAEVPGDPRDKYALIVDLHCIVPFLVPVA